MHTHYSNRLSPPRPSQLARDAYQGRVQCSVDLDAGGGGVHVGALGGAGGEGVQLGRGGEVVGGGAGLGQLGRCQGSGGLPGDLTPYRFSGFPTSSKNESLAISLPAFFFL